jgi:large subunit ribosomal protein L23
MNQERLMKLLLAPVVSEKSTVAAEASNQYVFKVVADASKPEIKKAVETLFKVEVSGVRMLTVKGKRKRFGQIQGRRSDWKKAYVTVKGDQEIDFMGGAE